MRETQRKIREYKAMLPKAKEKLFAVLMLVVISATIMATATFAWLTLSWSPEMKNITTTFSANGSLEIALSDVDGLAPDKTAVGDSGLAIIEKNLTWGNLINLADDSYGFENLTLRPASLNRNKLLTKPIYGADYGEDGRIIKMNSDFAYANWYNDVENNNSYFLVPSSTQYGVRAISSVVYTDVGGDTAFSELSQSAETLILQASTEYQSLMANPTYIKAIEDFIGAYGTAVMNKTTATFDCKDYIPDLYLMMVDLNSGMETAGKSLMRIAEMQQMIALGRDNYTPYATVDEFLAASNAQLTQNGVSVSVLTSFSAYKTDMNNMKNDLVAMAGYAQTARDGGSVMWTTVKPIINRLINIDNTTLNGKKISQLGVSDASSIMGSSSNKVLIPAGYIYSQENRLGSYMNDGRGIDVTVKVNYIFTQSVAANVKTTATGHTLDDDKSAVEASNTGSWQGGTPIAEDTFGFAVDFWVRTNAAASYLTLEGKLITETTYERATFYYPPDDTTYDLWTANVRITDPDTGESVTNKTDVVQKDGRWYARKDASIFDVTDSISGTPSEKYNEIVTYLGYEGDHRIWEDDPNISKFSTSQGNGSCYTFYADTPTDLAQSLQLLDAMKVVFFDEAGTLLATANMDTEHYFSLNGKVTVPLVIDENESQTATDYNGNEVKAITELKRNVATRISALVYLDGTKITNDKVLSASDIQGQLNVQFGSTAKLLPIGDEKLEQAERHVSATIDRTSFNYDTDAGNMRSVVTVTVDGDQPERITAIFLRAVTSSQGTREAEITFVKDGDVWRATKEFNLPGNYVLRSVRLDGIDFDLDSPLNVTISGFSVQSLNCPDCDSEGKATLLTASNSIQTAVNLKFVSDDPATMPSKVQAVFLNEDNVQSTVNMNINSTTQIWSGAATFTTSGVYRLEYLKLNDQFYPIDTPLQKEVTVFVGLKTRVWVDDHPVSFYYYGPETVPVSATIMDNTGAELQTVMPDVKLYYSQRGSAIKGVNSNMTWDAEASRYVGAFNISSPGTFIFSQLTVGVNTITGATYTPTILSIPTDPIGYYDSAPMADLAFQFAPDNNAKMVIRMSYSSAADVYALIKNTLTNNSYVSKGIMGVETTIEGVPVTEWTFDVPKELGTQDGNWQMTALKAGNVYYDDVFHECVNPIETVAQFNDSSFEDYLAVEMNDTGVVTYVASTVYVTFPEGQSRNFGAGATVGYQDATGTFMEPHEIAGLNVTIADKNGTALPGITDVVLSYHRKAGTEQTYGAYTSDALTGVTDKEMFDIGFESANGKNFTQTGTHSVMIAGEYEPTFSFSVSGKSYAYGGTDQPALPQRTPTFTISSKAPTVTIIGTDPTPSEAYNINLASGTDSNLLQVNNYFEDYFAHVNMVCSETGTCASYTPSQITVRLNDAGSNFTNTVFYIPNPGGDSYANTFTFSADNQAQTENVGAVDSSTRKTAGTQTIRTVSMVSDGVTYTVNLSNTITIVQDNKALPKVKFTGLTEYAGHANPDVLGRNPTVGGVMLPTVEEWTGTLTEASGESAPTVTTSTSKPYYTKRTTTGCNATTYYTPYTRTTTTETSQAVTTTYNSSYRLVGWTDGTNTYEPGSKYTMAATATDVTLTAVVETTTDTQHPVTSTQTHIVIYMQDTAGSETQTKPSGASETTADKLYTTKTKTSDTWTNG